MDKSLQNAEAATLLFEYTSIQKDWAEAKLALQQLILNLLENDMPALYQLLYRIDIDENKARQAFGVDTASIANALAELIMQRILQKAESRMKYKS